MSQEINNPFYPIYFHKIGQSYYQLQEENLSQALESLDSAMQKLHFSYALESNYNKHFDDFRATETMKKLRFARQEIKDLHDMMSLQLQKENEKNATKAFLKVEDKNV